VEIVADFKFQHYESAEKVLARKMFRPAVPIANWPQTYVALPDIDIGLELDAPLDAIPPSHRGPRFEAGANKCFARPVMANDRAESAEEMAGSLRAAFPSK
jgi:hypothetical protein